MNDRGNKMKFFQVTIFLTMEQSRHARDALAKAIYAAMFEWVVGRTNECIEAKQAEIMTEDRIFIGLLDIFGKDKERKGRRAISYVRSSRVD